uniref:Uncharacterized protein n=1 Tax=Glossina pallidipes TaxID=7398 RepID=A0A1A9ZB78_GLOPL
MIGTLKHLDLLNPRSPLKQTERPGIELTVLTPLAVSVCVAGLHCSAFCRFGFKGSNSAGVALLSINAFFLLFASLGISKGLNMAPNIMQFRTIPPIINNAPLQPKLPIKCSVKGAKTNVPKPDPHTAIPVAKERRASNHTLTLTMAGR